LQTGERADSNRADFSFGKSMEFWLTQTDCAGGGGQIPFEVNVDRPLNKGGELLFIVNFISLTGTVVMHSVLIFCPALCITVEEYFFFCNTEWSLMMSEKEMPEVPLPLAAARLGLTWHQAWSLILTRQIKGRRSGKHWFADEQSVAEYESLHPAPVA
jgi:hypothetical protein